MKDAEVLHHKFFSSPVGELKLVSSDTHLIALLWPNDREGRVTVGETRPNDRHPLLQGAAVQLREYFDGKRRHFELPIEFRGGTDFQTQVWRALTAIPFGVTRSYAEIACQVGRPKACRAVGAANGRNPLSIIVPCHRVLGVNGSLTGFAAGNAAKAYLLWLEAVSVGKVGNLFQHDVEQLALTRAGGDGAFKSKRPL